MHGCGERHVRADLRFTYEREGGVAVLVADSGFHGPPMPLGSSMLRRVRSEAEKKGGGECVQRR